MNSLTRPTSPIASASAVVNEAASPSANGNSPMRTPEDAVSKIASTTRSMSSDVAGRDGTNSTGKPSPSPISASSSIVHSASRASERAASRSGSMTLMSLSLSNPRTIRGVPEVTTFDTNALISCCEVMTSSTSGCSERRVIGPPMSKFASLTALSMSLRVSDGCTSTVGSDAVFVLGLVRTLVRIANAGTRSIPSPSAGYSGLANPPAITTAPSYAGMEMALCCHWSIC